MKVVSKIKRKSRSSEKHFFQKTIEKNEKGKKEKRKAKVWEEA